MIRKLIAVVLSLGLLLSQLHVLVGALDPRGQAAKISQQVSLNAPDIARAKAFFSTLQSQDTPAVKARMNSAYLDNNFDLIMERVYLHLPREAPKSITPVGYDARIEGDRRFTFVALEYEFSDKWVVAVITNEYSPQGQAIAGFNLNSYKASLLERTRFRLEGQSLEHYVLLGLAVINLVFCAVTLFICIAAPRVRWRFLWIALTLIGMGLMSFNWLEGQMAVSLFTAGLPPTRLSLSVYQPLIIMLSIPVGAIIFWINFRRLTTAGDKRLPRPFNAAERS